MHPNRFIGRTYQEEVDWLKQWIVGRLAWIDSQGFPEPKLEVVMSPRVGTRKVTLAADGGPTRPMVLTRAFAAAMAPKARKRTRHRARRMASPTFRASGPTPPIHRSSGRIR